MGRNNKPIIKIDYDGEYPNLCSGHLIVYINNIKYNFPDYCLSSGGCVCRDDDWNMWAESGPWNICDWPINFPEDLKDSTLDEINVTIPWGCCGGCI